MLHPVCSKRYITNSLMHPACTEGVFGTNDLPITNDYTYTQHQQYLREAKSRRSDLVLNSTFILCGSQSLV